MLNVTPPPPPVNNVYSEKPWHDSSKSLRQPIRLNKDPPLHRYFTVGCQTWESSVQEKRIKLYDTSYTQLQWHSPGAAHMSSMTSPGCGLRMWAHNVEGKFWGNISSGNSPFSLGDMYIGSVTSIPMPLQPNKYMCVILLAIWLNHNKLSCIITIVVIFMDARKKINH